MRIAITGGTGTVGAATARELARRGHDVRLLSRRPPREPLAGAEHHAVDLRDGSGLVSALDGVGAVVHAANSKPSRRAAQQVLAAALPLQPIDHREVAGALADTVEAEPSGAITELAGPEVLTLRELVHLWRRARGRRALALPVPLIGRRGRALRAGALTGPGAWRGAATFQEWLAA